MPTSAAATISCVAALRNGINIPFVVIGGASIIINGSSRTTEDVDILVPPNTDIEALRAQLKNTPDFTMNAAGKIIFRPSGHGQATTTTTTPATVTIPIDILTHAVGTFSLDDLGHNTITTPIVACDDVKVMKWDFALAVKLNCFYHRADDENGERKKRTDAQDIVYLSTKMCQAGQKISDECAANSNFKIGYYHMMVIREALKAQEFDRLVEVGVEKLLVPWEENTDAQKEYYLYMAEEGTNPLTVPLEEEEVEEMEE